MDFPTFKYNLTCKSPHIIEKPGDAKTWYFNDVELFRENFYWSQLPPSVRIAEYWSNTIYTDYNLIIKEHDKYNAKIQKSWKGEEHFWFLIFNNAENAIRHSFEQNSTDFWDRHYVPKEDNKLNKEIIPHNYAALLAERYKHKLSPINLYNTDSKNIKDNNDNNNNNKDNKKDTIKITLPEIKKDIKPIIYSVRADFTKKSNISVLEFA